MFCLREERADEELASAVRARSVEEGSGSETGLGEVGPLEGDILVLWN